MKKGDIYLCDFGKSRDSFEFGKHRPVVIFQTDKLNYAVSEGIYNYFLVIPLSSKNDIVTDEFRFKIKPRERLKLESFLVCNSICFLDKKYFSEKLGSISDEEILEVENILKNLFDFRN